MDVGVLFGAIVAMVMIALILVYGYQQIGGITDFQESAEELRAISTFEAQVENVYSMSGESSEYVRLGFPSSVDRICFIPIYDFSYNPKIQYPKWKMKQALEDIGINKDAASNLVEMRMLGSASDYTDRNYTLLVSYKGYDMPRWYEVEHLGPSEKADGFLCKKAGESVWLQRDWDQNGAWVDVEES